jgi:Bardet-Biedl syndrome 2 protein
MRKWYLELNDVNTDMIRGYNIRCKNHQELLESLKELNVIIQKAARLRGKSFFNLGRLKPGKV